MANSGLSRRTFVASTGAASAAAAAGRRPVAFPPFAASPLKARGDPIRIVTTYRFEPREVQQIQEAAAPTAVEITIRAKDDFLDQVKDAEVVYGRIRGQDLARAPNLQWVQNGGAGVEWLMGDEAFRQSLPANKDGLESLVREQAGGKPGEREFFQHANPLLVRHHRLIKGKRNSNAPVSGCCLM